MEDFGEIFRNKIVLITGGTGFLGRALIKEILKLKMFVSYLRREFLLLLTFIRTRMLFIRNKS